MRSQLAWRALLQGKTPYQAAQIILGDLIGYRKASRHRVDDADSLTNAIIAIAAIERGKTNV